MSPAGFEPATPARERPQTPALDRAVTSIGSKSITVYVNKTPKKKTKEGDDLRSWNPRSASIRSRCNDTDFDMKETLPIIRSVSSCHPLDLLETSKAAKPSISFSEHND